MGFFSGRDKRRRDYDERPKRDKREHGGRQESFTATAGRRMHEGDADAELARRLQEEEYENSGDDHDTSTQMPTVGRDDDLPYRGKGKEPAKSSYDEVDRFGYRRGKSSSGAREDDLRTGSHRQDKTALKQAHTQRDDELSEDKFYRHERSEKRSSEDRLGPTTLKQDMETMRRYTKAVVRVGCRKCRRHTVGDFDPQEHVTEWKKYANGKAPDANGANSLSAVQCSYCRPAIYTCAGCGEKPNGRAPVVDVDKLCLSWCCEAGRLFSIWVLLCRYDEEEIQVQSEAASTKPKPKKGTGKAAGQGTGYSEHGAILSSGSVGTPGMDVSKVRAIDGRSDKTTQQTMELLTALLPEPGRTGLGSFNSSPAKQVPAMLKCSLILDKAAELARNDSIEDVTKRYGLYIALLNFIGRIGGLSNTRYLIHDEREIKRQTSGLFDISFEGSRAVSLADPKDTASSIATRLRDIVAQAQAVIEGAKNVSSKSSPGYGDSTGETTMKLCRQFCETAKAIGMVSIQNEDLGSSRNVRTAWENYEKLNHFTYVEDDLIINKQSYHYFDRLSAKGAPKRMQRIIGECATMKTSLPPGLFIKACMTRPDAMKALIIGPPDTPYEGGIFECDILLPGEYPSVPPKIHFRTPKWQADFNPNIHPKNAAAPDFLSGLEFEAMGLLGSKMDMAVCLSLLNTWPGEPSEQWQPSKSTLLQVLISMQSMIFVPEPFFNEPGRDTRSAEARKLSAQYNKVREPMTIFYGMLLWLRDPERKTGIWKGIVHEYFKANADRLVKVVRKWARRNEEITKWQGYVTSAVGGIGSVVEYEGKGRNLLVWLEAALSDYRELG